MNNSTQQNTGTGRWLKHTIMLRAGSWRHKMNDMQFRVITAMALNDCTGRQSPFKKTVRVTGYLISNNNVFVILRLDNTEVAGVLTYFYERVRQ